MILSNLVACILINCLCNLVPYCPILCYHSGLINSPPIPLQVVMLLIFSLSRNIRFCILFLVCTNAIQRNTQCSGGDFVEKYVPSTILLCYLYIV
jgi:hypothetical protein